MIHPYALTSPTTYAFLKVIFDDLGLPVITMIIGLLTGIKMIHRHTIVTLTFIAFTITAFFSPVLDVMHPHGWDLFFAGMCNTSSSTEPVGMGCNYQNYLKFTPLYVTTMYLATAFAAFASAFLTVFEVSMALKNGISYWTLAGFAGFCGCVVLLWTRLGILPR